MSNQHSSNVPHSKPMAIPIGHPRRRSESVSDSSSSPPSSNSSDSSYSPPLNTPFANDRGNRPRVAPISPSSSPILSYFLAQPPKSPTGSFPFRRNFGPTVMEGPPSNYFPPYSIILKDPSLLVDDDSENPSIPKHPRRASMASWPISDRPPQPPQVPPPIAEDQHDRAAGLLRRLSLGGALTRVSLLLFFIDRTLNLILPNVLCCY